MNVDNLPRRRTGSFLAWIADLPLSLTLLFGIGVYGAVPITLSIVEAICTGHVFVVDQTGTSPTKVHGLGELLYFNLISTTTIGYGDLRPVGIGRLFSGLEAVWGTIFLGVVLAITTLKVVQPPRRAICFSRYGYYSLKEQRFLVIFVNTTKTVLVNPEMCSYYRQGDRWTVKPADRAPFIRGSVWTFFVDRITLDDLRHGPQEDCSLRFGITGQLGLSTVSEYVEYEPANILVIPDRQELVTFKGFLNADLKNLEVRRMFHYQPQECSTLEELLAQS